MPSSLRATDLQALNVLTKYPSILTYHPLDPRQSRSRGKHEEPGPLVNFTGPVLITEKIDGVNARIILTPDDSYLIGSREELLYARGDLLHNPAMSIVETVRPIAERIVSRVRHPDSLIVCYGEVYGGKVSDGSRQYTGEQQLGFRIFDVAVIADLTLLSRSVERLVAWREGGGQGFVNEAELQRLTREWGVALTPRIREIESEDLPESIADAFAFLHAVLPESRVALDAGAGKRGEGVVLRSLDRSAIAKLRFKDYQELCKGRKKH